MCFSPPSVSQNAPEAGDQITQLLSGEGDRSLPQAGMYSSEVGWPHGSKCHLLPCMLCFPAFLLPGTAALREGQVNSLWQEKGWESVGPSPQELNGLSQIPKSTLNFIVKLLRCMGKQAWVF